jgi:rod shape-determining protein MreD
LRWFGFVLMAFVLLVLQVGVVGPLGLGPQRVVPDLLLLAAVLLAFRGSGYQVLVGCWILGMMKDMNSQASLGSYALAFGLMGWGIMRVRDLFYGDHPVTLILITFAGCFFVEHLVLLVGIVRGDLSGAGMGGLWLSIIFSGAFTAGLSPYGQWLMMRFHRQLGLARRRSYQ